MEFGVLVRVRIRIKMRMIRNGVIRIRLIRIRLIRIKVIRIVYTPIFSILRVDIGGANFLIETPFCNDYILAYYIYFFMYII